MRDTRIERVLQEASNIRSFFFKDEASLAAEPGQFIMVWIPGAGEFPMSLSLPSEKERFASIGVKGMGKGSKLLYEAQAGDYMGVRGPYGRGFDLETYFGRGHSASKKNALLVGGGTGMVPMLVLAKALVKKSVKTSIVIGAKTRIELPFLRIAKKLVGSKSVFAATDDGTFGFKGLAHELVEYVLSNNNCKFNEIFSCGPEKMMVRIYEISRKRGISAQFSLERIMKCGIGICGSCIIGDRVLCTDGPVLNPSKLESIKSEFGSLQRNMSGTLSPI
jgi:dihydroorotate dehydrogenase electron transfer subunit